MADVQLQNKEQFEQLLKDYRPSREAIEILDQAKVLFLVGPSGCGRNTLIEHLVDTGDYYFVRSDTTRPRRMHRGRLENDGEFYWHITEDAFLDGLKRGDYLEAAIIHNQQVSGSNRMQYRIAYSQNKIAVSDIEGIYGPPVFHGFSNKIQFIFLVPPSFDIWIDRLNRRGVMPEQELVRRLKSAQKELTAAFDRDYYHYVVSNEIAKSVISTNRIMNGEPGLETEAEAKKIAVKLLDDIQEFLSKR